MCMADNRRKKNTLLEDLELYFSDEEDADEPTTSISRYPKPAMGTLKETDQNI